MTTQTKLPDWLTAAIEKYSLVSVASTREIFEVYFDENNTVESPRFRKLCERLVRLKKVKARFVTSLESNGFFDEDVDLEADLDDTDEFTDDEDFEDDSSEAEFEDDEDDGEASSEDDGEELEASDYEDDEAEAEDVAEDAEDAEEAPEPVKRGVGRPRTKPVSQYEDTGIPTLDEVTALIGDSYKHTQEFDDPTHLRIAAMALGEDGLGFSIDYDSRVGGGIKRPRGGRFVLTISVSEKRAVKRRGKVAPVFAFVEQITNAYDAESASIIGELVSEAIAEE